MLYEEEAHSSSSEDRTERSYEPTVEIVSQLKKERKDISSTQTESSFIHWWPRAAKIVMNGLYGTEEEKKEAVKALIPILTRYVRVDPPAFEVTTQELMPLNELYKKRLEFDKQEIRILLIGWMELIQSFLSHATQLVEKRDAVFKEIDDFGDNIYTNFYKKIDKVTLKSTVLSRQSIYKGFLEKCTFLELKSLRYDLMSRQSINVGQQSCDINCQIESEVEKLSSHMPIESIMAMKSIYTSHLQNIESDAANDLKKMCLHSWIRALK